MSAVLEAHGLYRFFHAGDDETLALRGVSLARRRAVRSSPCTGPSGRASRRCWTASPASTNPTAAWSCVAGERLTRRPERDARAHPGPPHRAALPERQPRRAPRRSTATSPSPVAWPAIDRDDHVRGVLERLPTSLTAPAPARRPAVRRRAGARRARRRAGQRPAGRPRRRTDRRARQVDRRSACSTLLAPARRRTAPRSLVVTHEPAGRARRADREIRLRDGQRAVVSRRARRWSAASARGRTYGSGAARHRGAPAAPTARSCARRPHRARSARRARASPRSCTSSPGSTTPTSGTVEWPALGDRAQLRPGPGRRRLPGAEPAAAARRRSRTSPCPLLLDGATDADARNARATRRSQLLDLDELGRQAAGGALRRAGAARRRRARRGTPSRA